MRTVSQYQCLAWLRQCLAAAEVSAVDGPRHGGPWPVCALPRFKASCCQLS